MFIRNSRHKLSKLVAGHCRM